MKRIFIILISLSIVCSTLLCYGIKSKESKYNLVADNDYKVDIVIQNNYIDTRAKDTWQEDDAILSLDNLKKMIGGEEDRLGNTEKKITVAVIDTGIFPHERLCYPKNQIKYSVDFVNQKNFLYDDNGHGTAIAGIITAFGIAGNYEDYREESFIDFVSVKVLDYQREGYAKNIIKGINWVIENKDIYNISIINLSIGVPCNGEEDILSRTVKKANDEGILVITSSGNVKKGVAAYSPAVEPTCLSVGATWNSLFSEINQYSIASFTMRWEKDGKQYPVIYAPGCKIETLKSNIYYRGEEIITRSNELTVTTGTSISAAVVTGVAAYYMHCYPNKSIEEIKEMIFNTSQSIRDRDLELEYKLIHIGE